MTFTVSMMHWSKDSVINCSRTERTSIPICASTHIEVLQQYVKENHLDVGFAYDGDADRCIAVDEKCDRRSISILYVCGKYSWRMTFEW